MASDITLAVGDGARRMTYAELAAVRGTLQPSAERLARRRGWPRQVGNDGVARVLVPLAEARYVSKPAASGVAPATAVLAPDKRELAPVTSEGPPPAGPGQSPGQVAPDDRGHVRGLEDAFEALRDQLGVANDSLISERRRGDELQALLTEERRRIDGLHMDLADARTAAMITGCEAAALRAQLALLTDQRRPWWRRWFR